MFFSCVITFPFVSFIIFTCCTSFPLLSLPGQSVKIFPPFHTSHMHLTLPLPPPLFDCTSFTFGGSQYRVCPISSLCLSSYLLLNPPPGLVVCFPPSRCHAKYILRLFFRRFLNLCPTDLFPVC